MSIAVVGDVGVDYYKNLNLIKPGGIAFNFAYGLISNGQKSVSLISAIGTDEYSKKILKLIKKLKIKSSHIQILKGTTPQQNILLKNGERKFVGYQAGILKKWKLMKSNVDFLKSQDAIFVPLSDGMEHIFKKIIKIKTGPLMITDFSQDYEFADFDKKENMITKYSKFFDIIFVGGKKKHEKIVKELTTKYPEKTFVLTLGKYGSVAYKKGVKYFQGAKSIKTTDSTGAGDSFQSAFISEYFKTNKINKALHKSTKKALKTISYVGSTPNTI